MCVEKTLKNILDRVQKPGRYIGQETNIVIKDWEGDKLKFALIYPDLYEVGMSYFGLRLLYHLLNEKEGIICERAFTPAGDMEKILIDEGIPLFSLETKRPLKDFDMVGFSLSYELNYTNVLNMLSLGGISVRSADRKEEEPLVIAGGACCFNPEPMSLFIDAFIIGEAEESLPRFVEKYRELKKNKMPRKRILEELSALEGVYVPALYEACYSGAKFTRLKALGDKVPGYVKKTVVRDFETSYYPEKQIVPLIKIIHDRLIIEIMRGCPNKCRFCQANVINRPVRIKSIDRIRRIARAAYDNTGYDQVSLLSLSSVNYPRITELVKGLKNDFPNREISISVPSLRVDEAFYDLPEMMSTLQKGALTFAPETADDRLRGALGKNIDMNVLCRSVQLAYQHGWKRVKLYFMVGFPGEGEKEMEDIVRLARDISNLRRQLFNSSAEVAVSVNPFVPKPQTPLQWMGMSSNEELVNARRILTGKNSKKIEISMGDIAQAEVEAALARGDRRVGEVIFTAWKDGSRMDGTGDSFNRGLWDGAFEKNGLAVDQFARATYSVDDVLPWDHIKTEVDRKFLEEEFHESGFDKITPDICL